MKPTVVLMGRINNSQDGKVISVQGISLCHTSGHNNTPKIIEIVYEDLQDVPVSERSQ